MPNLPDVSASVLIHLLAVPVEVGLLLSAVAVLRRPRNACPAPRTRATGGRGRHTCRPWTPWRNHHCARPRPVPHGVSQLLGGISAFQRHTAPLIRDELARLAREGQRPTQLFLTCADSRLVTSMITTSGPGDLFTVRNVGNLVPPPGKEAACESVAAAIEYAVEVLEVGAITVCGHSGCGAMQALLRAIPAPTPTPAPVPSPAQAGSAAAGTSLSRWLRHGRPSVERLATAERELLTHRAVADEVERLCLVNIVQQLDHLMAHTCVSRRMAQGRLRLYGMYFHVAEAQAYLLDPASGRFAPVHPETHPGMPGQV